MDWRIATGIICCFGIFKDFRPSDSYITAYLIAPEWKNLTIEQVNNEVYPVLAYSYLTTLIFVLLFTDYFRYKVLIIIEAISYISTWIILLWGEGVLLMQLTQFTFGWAMSTEIAYYSYIYAAVSETHYRKVSSFVRSSSLVGRFIAALLGQLLLTFAGATYFILNVISFTNVCICFFVALMLPKIKKSFYFEVDFKTDTKKTLSSKYTKQSNTGKDEIGFTKVTEKNSEDTEDNAKECNGAQLMTESHEMEALDSKEPASVLKNEEEADLCSAGQEEKMISAEDKDQISNSPILPKRTENDYQLRRSNRPLLKGCLHKLKKPKLKEIPSNLESSVSIREGLHRMWSDFLGAYKDQKLLLWSIWWASTTCGKVHLSNYIQSLYEVIRVDQRSASNYNAAIDATSLAICAAASFGIGFVKVNWSRYGELLLFFVNIVIGALMIWMSFTDNIWIAYICYLFIRIIFQTVLTIATYQVAVHLSSRCYGLVFGLNTFMALLLETILTVIVVDKHGLNLDVRTQFIVYGGYFGILALPFLVKFFYNCFLKRNQIELPEVC